MKETENVQFDSMPQLHTGTFLTKEQAEQFKNLFKDVVTVTRCRDCKYNDDGECIIKAGWFPVTPDWFCADGERQEGREVV